MLLMSTNKIENLRTLKAYELITTHWITTIYAENYPEANAQGKELVRQFKEATKDNENQNLRNTDLEYKTVRLITN
jgi:hypothetical protein